MSESTTTTTPAPLGIISAEIPKPTPGAEAAPLTLTSAAEAAPFDFGEVGDTTDHTYRPFHPATGQPIPGVEFYVAGEDTEHFRAATRYAQKRLTQRARKTQQQGNAATLFQIEQLARVLKGWTGVVWHGAPLPYTPENAEMLFRERGFVLEGLAEFVRDRETRLGKFAGGTLD